MKLINCSFCRVDYLSVSDAMHITFKGNVMKHHIIKIRSIIDGLSESLKIDKLILDFTECDEAHFDYNSHARISFWKNLKAHGLLKTVLIFRQKDYTSSALSAWESFYGNNNLDIKIFAVSDKKFRTPVVANKPKLSLSDHSGI